MKTKLLITDVEPWAMENPRNIRTAALFVQVNNKKIIKAFVPDWDSLHFAGMSLDEIKKFLVGREVNAELHLMDLSLNIKKKSLSASKVVQLKNAHVEIIGKVIGLNGPFIHTFSQDGKPVNYEYFSVDLDCGIAIIEVIISSFKVKENNLKVGDYIEAEGRLDITIKKIFDEEKNKHEH